ncbi:MAG TPA: glycosyltransferase family 4 protein [Candidatus Paceibacterota bacterium]
MRLLIFTQKVDRNDSVLGFFHNWIIEIAKKVEEVQIICLEKGEFDFPKNAKVYSLGKEKGVSKLRRIINLYKYLWIIRGSYDKVFVHMNEEYVWLLGLYWRIIGVPVYMWRNHPRGAFLTRVAVLFSTKVFCTSTSSFTARFKKTAIMPAGIDTKIFRVVDGVVRKKYSICMIGRISPVKHIELGLEAFGRLVASGSQASLNIIGSTVERDIEYYDKLKEYVLEHNLSNSISFTSAVTPDKLAEIYSSYEICLNLTESGSFDKTIVEATACGCIPLVSNTSLRSLLPEACITEATSEEIAKSIERLLDAHSQMETVEKLKPFVESQSLDLLVKRLFEEMA